MDFGCRLLHRAADVEICGARVFRVDAALETDFRGAARPRLGDAPAHLVEREIIGAPAQVRRQLALGEGAELAAVGAHVGIVDVAVDDIAHERSDALGAHAVGGCAHLVELAAARSKKPHDVRFGKLRAIGCTRDYVFEPAIFCGTRRDHGARGGGAQPEPATHASGRAKPSMSIWSSTAALSPGSTQRARSSA